MFPTFAKISCRTKGPGEEGAPRKHPEISSQNVVDFECRFPYGPVIPMERTEHHFGSFWEKDFGAIFGGPPLPAPLFYS